MVPTPNFSDYCEDLSGVEQIIDAEHAQVLKMFMVEEALLHGQQGGEFLGDRLEHEATRSRSK